jgi:hypothetical protein
MTQTRAAQLYAKWDQDKATAEAIANARRCDHNPSCNGQSDTTAWMAAQRAKALADERSCERNPLCGSNGVIEINDTPKIDNNPPTGIHCSSLYCAPGWKNNLVEPTGTTSTSGTDDESSICPPDLPNCEPLTGVQKVGWGVTLVLLDLVILGPLDLVLAGASVYGALGCLFGGGLIFCLADIPLAALDYAAAEFTVSVNVYMGTSIGNGYKSDFKWIITSQLMSPSP